MKRLFLTIIAVVAISLAAVAQNLTITGTVNGLPDGTVLSIVPVSHDNDKAMAEGKLAAGKFEIKTDVQEPLLVVFKVNDDYSSLKFMVNTGDNISVTVGKVDKKMYSSAYYEMSDVIVTGSSLNAKYKELTSVHDTLDQIRSDFERRYSPLQSKISAAGKDKVKMDAIKATDEYKAMEKEDNDFFHTVEAKYTNLFNANKDTFWGPLLMVNFMSYLTAEQKPYYESLPEQVKKSFYGKKIYDEIFPGGGVGTKLQSFTLKDEAGKSYTLEQLLKGKKYLLIDFWASWCAPCRKEIPNVKKNYEQYKNHGFEVVSISIDQNAAAWKKAVQQEQLKWPNFLSPAVANQFKVRAVPTMYLIDANGVVLGINEDVRGEALGKKLAELFK
jgi:thiol-disulfide isomerase/thioredoxin